MAVIFGLGAAFLAREVLSTTALTPLQTAPVRLCGGWLGTNLGTLQQQMVFLQMAVGPLRHLYEHRSADGSANRPL